MTMNEVSLKDKILNVLSESKKTLTGLEDTYLYRLIESSVIRLSQPMQLAIIGKISSSKSTLVNAILGAPEIVRTGQMEETFNVSWLKYGESKSDIKVYFKDGRVCDVPIDEWGKWTSHQEQNVLKEQVRYIEVPYQSDILKEINIIDTPGLDALTQIDSKNTIAFLKEVKPDAVIMLFTKSIAETTLSILQDFQNVGSNDFNLSALNAIGVLAKVDTMWTPFDDGEDVIVKGKRVVKTTLYDKYPEVRKSLFTILPVSSLMGLASSSINDGDVIALRRLATLSNDTINEMLSSAEFFVDECYQIEVDVPTRKELYNKFGLYGISVLVEGLKNNRDVNRDFLADILRRKSGFDKLYLTILSHFGGRSTLIKSQSILKELISAITLAKAENTGGVYNAFAEVENMIVSTLLSMHEYREWEYLSKYYDGRLEISTNEAEEFIALCGEQGYSAPHRLRIESNLSPDDLYNLAVKRAQHWQKQYNIISDIDPDAGNFYKVMISSYNKLIKDIRQASSLYSEAKTTMERTAMFLGYNNYNTTEQ